MTPNQTRAVLRPINIGAAAKCEKCEKTLRGNFKYRPQQSEGYFMALAESASRRKSEFDITAEYLMDDSDRAAKVRQWRVVERYSWRGVAQAAYEEFAGTWEPPSNQLMGMALCEAVAKQGGQDYMEGEWN